MDISRAEFIRTTDITLDFSRVNPVIEMKRDEILVKRIECVNKEGAQELFELVVSAWERQRANYNEY